MNRRTMIVSLASAVLVFCSSASLALAADEGPTGTWKWSVTFNDKTRDMSLKLKLEDGKLTGTMPGRDGQEIKIEDGKFEKGEISFKITRERNGEKFTTKYTGKLEGDTIKGKTESTFGGQERTRDWEAKRSKD